MLLKTQTYLKQTCTLVILKLQSINNKTKAKKKKINYVSKNYKRSILLIYIQKHNRYPNNMLNVIRIYTGGQTPRDEVSSNDGRCGIEHNSLW